jgi:hypothetical protein
MANKLLHAMIYVAAAIFGFVAIMWALFYIESKNPTDDEWK